MYGPAQQIVRIASRDYKIPNSNLIIPEGTFTGIPTSAIHNDPDYYPEPQIFDPERFNEENKVNRHPMAFLPFGDGPRNCIGLRFGLMQTKIAIISVLLKYKVVPSDKTLIPMKFDPKNPIQSPIGGNWLKIVKL